MSYNYSTYVNSLQTLLVATDTQGQANFNAMLPNIIDYAEQRIYRELDLLTTLTSLTTTASAFNRNVAVPSSAIVVQSANIITPASTAPDSGTRNPMTRSSVEYVNFIWPNGTTTLGISPSIPQYYGLQNNNGKFTSTSSNFTMVMAPPPDATYVVEMLATIRPTPLSPTNTVTFLTYVLPDLFLAASMVFGAGFQRDFGQQSDDPKLAQSWESQYQLLKASANVEELRKKAQSQDWSTMTPSPLVQRE